MRAIYIKSHGHEDSAVLGDMPVPEPGPGEARVRIASASLNRVDLYMRNSGAGITHELPLILGVDGAGVVDMPGPGVTGVAAGDRVVIYPVIYCGECEFCVRGDQMLCLRCRIVGEHRHGAFAEYACVPAHNLYPLPDDLSFDEAATLPTAYLTAWRMVTTQGELRPAETVLIHGIGGGVATAALQIVKLLGARAIVTSGSDAKLEAARDLGADGLVNYREQDVAEAAMEMTGGRGVDAVIENVGDATWGSSLRALRRGGRLVTCGATTGAQPGADLQRIFIRQLRIIGSTIGNRDEFRALLHAVRHRQIRPVVDKMFPLDKGLQALAYLDSGRQTGKVVLRVND
jgi:NADPH:quinone reductase-like Zn-dependent oxidoreductase